MALIDIDDDWAEAALDAMPNMDGGTLEGRTGASPGIANADSGTLLFEIDLPSPAFDAAAARERIAFAIANVVALADGTLGHVRGKDSGGVKRFDMKGGGSFIATFATASGDLQATTNVAHGYAANTLVEVYPEGAGVMPTGLTEGVPVYVSGPSGSVLKFSNTSGGAAIPYTNAGTGPLRIKLASVGFALQSATGGVLAGIEIGVSDCAIKFPHVSVG